MFEHMLSSGPLGMIAAALIVLSPGLLLVWLFLVCVKRRLFPWLLIGGVTLAAAGFSLQHHLSTSRSFNLGSVHLLPGYKLTHGQGTDSYVGSISRPGGLEIGIDIGAMAGLWANPGEPQKHVWVFEQTIRGHTVFIGLCPTGDNNTEKMLCVTYPRDAVNFYAVVHSDQEITEMLSMALTYELTTRLGL
jgi:hypothetical protein